MNTRPGESLNPASASELPVLCVDLDGTLITGDLLWESLFAVVRSSPQHLWKMPFWMRRGRASLKAGLAEASLANMDPLTLGFRPEVVAFLREQKQAGRKIVLATAADARLAHLVADHLGLFDEVIASDGVLNLKGAAKGAALVQRYGKQGFDYLGDSKADHAVWREANAAYVVAASPRVVEQSRRDYQVRHVFDVPHGGARSLFKALRPHQWAKNLLIFVPLMTSHQLGNPAMVLRALAAFFAFCSIASAVYLLNDLLDLPNDRLHKRKSKRPLASGKVSIPAGMAMFALLVILGAALATPLPRMFALVLAVYLALTTVYSFYLKTKLLVDVIALACLYTIRIIAGGAAADVVISSWLMAFSVFFFLSLAFAKRYVELDAAQGKPGKLVGRGYVASDLAMIGSMGPTSGYLSVVVLCLYLNSPDVSKLYSHPTRLWLLCPVLLYWIARVWFLTSRQELDEDPILFAVKDRHSYLAGALMAIIMGLSI